MQWSNPHFFFGVEGSEGRPSNQFFLDFSCHFHDPAILPGPEFVAAAGVASSIHLERGKVDAMGMGAPERGEQCRISECSL